MDYQAGWDAIKAALQTRIKAVTGGYDSARYDLPPFTYDLVINPGTVHIEYRDIDEMPLHGNWRESFVKDGVFATILIIRMSPGQDEVSGWMSSRALRYHQLELHIYRSYEQNVSWTVWNQLLDSIKTDLNKGDRTLNRTCISHSLPEVREHGMLSEFAGQGCHGAFLAFEIEEEC